METFRASSGPVSTRLVESVSEFSNRDFFFWDWTETRRTTRASEA